ncbi:24226_t:CDS:2 [Cetraspora pellucida]|uniref:orotate phosphoribosyltransferase n=1 Tax=Cetraspora pellucida TaxID=1433469 RepID=A0A9N9F6F2_9GLOM|nr:24226_t:CDS:2 [Cetraspora pellucida]
MGDSGTKKRIKTTKRAGKEPIQNKNNIPYFYDASKFNKGSTFTSIGNIYATVLKEATKQDYDLIFGSAYKGIPIALSTVSALADKYDMDISYSFNRKEKKDHGEGGNIVGSQLKGNVLVVDDVISTGTAIRESLEIIKENQANPVGVVVAVDRQEKGVGIYSAAQQIEQDYGIPVNSIVTLENIVHYLKEHGCYDKHLTKIEEYQAIYGVKN